MSATPNLGLTKITLGDTSWKADEDANKDILDGLFDPATGHTHDGTGTNGPPLAATAIAFTPAGTIAATTVQAAIEEVAAEAGGLSNPMTTPGDLIVGGTSGAPARLAKGSDGQVLTVDPATHLLAWSTPSGGGGGGGNFLYTPTPPVLAALTWVDQGTSTATDNGQGVQIVPQAAAYGFRMLTESYTSGAIRAEVAGFNATPVAQSSSFGVVFLPASGTKMVTALVSTNGEVYVIKWNNHVGSLAAEAHVSNFIQGGAAPLLVRLEETGGNYVASVSYDGLGWVALATVAVSSFMTVDKIGFFARCDSGTPWPIGFPHWRKG